MFKGEAKAGVRWPPKPIIELLQFIKGICFFNALGRNCGIWTGKLVFNPGCVETSKAGLGV